MRACYHDYYYYSYDHYSYESFQLYAPPTLCLPAPNARSSECAVYCNVLVVVDVVEVNVIMGVGMDSVVDVVEVNVIMGAGMHSLVSCFSANNGILLQLRKYLHGCYDRGCARNMKMLRANRGGGGGVGNYTIYVWPEVTDSLSHRAFTHSRKPAMDFLLGPKIHRGRI